MLDELLHFFTGFGKLEFTKSGEPSDEALKVATAALLWECCLADEKLETIEVNKLTKALRTAFNISEKEVEVISAICGAQHNAQKINEFVALLNDNFTPEQREKIVQLAGEIAVSDDLAVSEAIVCDVLRKRLKLS